MEVICVIGYKRVNKDTYEQDKSTFMSHSTISFIYGSSATVTLK
jgi:hypothetical protein